VIQQINHGISTGALFLIVGILYERRHTREISEYGGISNVMPVYATITLIMFMSSMGLPLLNGFVGEFTILQGTFMENKAWAAWAVPGVILAAAYLLWLYQRVFFGPVNNPKNEKLLDLSPRELATFVPLVILAFAIGLYPKPLFQILSTPINNLVATVRPDYPGLNKPVLATQPASAPQAGPSTSSIENQESVIPTEGPSALSGGTCYSPVAHRGASEKQVPRLRARAIRESRESQRQGGRSAQDDTAMKVHAATITTATAQLALANTK
jgi:NADH-quinone oxidoreductase subunit M